MQSGTNGSIGERRTIAIVGGIRPCGVEDRPSWTEDNGARAAREVGAELARAGYDLFVYSSAPRFVERDVVAGYLSVEPCRAGSIHVRPPYGSSETSFPHPPHKSGSFEIRHEAQDDWEVSYYRSLREADGVVLIGGGRTTLITAMVAMAFDIPLAPVAAFGGAARKAWVSMGRTGNLVTPEELSILGGEWNAGAAENVVAILRTQQERKQSAETMRSRAERHAKYKSGIGLLFGALLLIGGFAMIPLVYAVDSNASLTLVGLIAGSLLAATSGAIIRTAVDRREDWARSSVLGMSAGAIAVLLFISAQLATSPDLLTGPGARRLLFFVLSVGFIAGYTFDAVYAKIRQQQVVDTSGLRSVLPEPQADQNGH
ncbi:hypothetical protein [Nocardia sp. NPDC047038]|uniref:hypothetical protein n=1 Tax=Nocardia sp. NPDC047038 TaxID=3154338 RepID=UPI0033CB7C24